MANQMVESKLKSVRKDGGVMGSQGKECEHGASEDQYVG